LGNGDRAVADTHCAYLRLPHRLFDTSLEGLIEAIRGR
jgi:hypothetical protein